jgi:hypothetical protein
MAGFNLKISTCMQEDCLIIEKFSAFFALKNGLRSEKIYLQFNDSVRLLPKRLQITVSGPRDLVIYPRSTFPNLNQILNGFLHMPRNPK